MVPQIVAEQDALVTQIESAGSDNWVRPGGSVAAIGLVKAALFAVLLESERMATSNRVHDKWLSDLHRARFGTVPFRPVLRELRRSGKPGRTGIRTHVVGKALLGKWDQLEEERWR